jgi:DNA-binding CsgD family transcriptional regulator
MSRGIVNPSKQRPDRQAACGTTAAYRRHLRYKEPLDELCEKLKPEQRRDPDTGLTVRQQEIAAYVAQGLDNEQIAAKLVLSLQTIKSHLRLAFKQLGIAHRAELVAYVYRNGLLPLDELRDGKEMVAVPRDLYLLLVAVARSTDERRPDAQLLAGQASERLGLKTGRPRGHPTARPAGGQRVSPPSPDRT